MPPRPSPSIAPICPYFFQCGGCDSQDVSYADQLAYKEQVLREYFAGFPDVTWQPIAHEASEYPLYYRNKIRFGFIATESGIRPSRHQKESEEADIPVDRCFLQSPECDVVMNEIASAIEQYGWTLYDPNQRTGWLKHILVRQGKHTSDMMLALVTDDQPIPYEAEWLASLRERLPMLTSVYHSVSWGPSVDALQDRLLYGTPTIREQVGEYRFHISPQAFFQTNSNMLPQLYNGIAEAAALTGTEQVWDLYAGSATIGTYLSKQAGQVVAIERNPANIEDAKRNLEENDVHNVEIAAGSVESVLSSAFISSHGAPDVVVVDPPRAGLSEQIRRILPHLPHSRLVYVSCNPSTAKRDIEQLCSRGYTLRTLRGYDMFPHTWHCELIATLEK